MERQIKMKNKNKSFHNEYGGMMLEILLSLAIMAAALPFVLREFNGRMGRAENVKIARDIAMTRDALERYMDAHKREFFLPTSRSVTRVKISELAQYGNLPKDKDRFQARIIKSKDSGGRSVLSGMVIFDSDDISPVRTREIASLGGESSGFIDRSEVHGAFGTWRNKISVFDASFGKDSIVQGTKSILSGSNFLWRLPSKDNSDSAMASDLSLGGYDINNVDTVDSYNTDFTEIFKAGLISAQKVQIKPRTNWQTNLTISGDARVVGSLTADSRNAEISGALLLNDSARIYRLEANDLWVRELNLNGFSIGGSDEPATLKVGKTIDITRGRITSIVATVGYMGSVAPKIIVTSRIEDSANPEYYWDLDSSQAVFSDVMVVQLPNMIKESINAESVNPETKTESIINQVAANNNATIADYVNALNEIKTQVMQKYNNLNLESGVVE